MSAPQEEITGGDPLNVPRARPPRSHTHLSASDIRRDLRIGFLERIFLWLAKTDLYVLHVVPNNCRVQLQSLGMMVVFTTMLAFGSALYVVMTGVLPPDDSEAIPWIPMAIALIYAFGILIIDREIVGAVANRAIWLRVLFAVFVAVTVSWPVKLKFFEGRVNVEINRMVDERNSHRYAEIQAHNDQIENLNNEIELLRESGSPARQQRRMGIQARIDSYDREIKVLDSEIEKESKNVRCGPKCQAYRDQKAEIVKERRQAEEELASLEKPMPLTEETVQEVQRKQSAIEKEERQIAQLKEQIDHEHSISYDILTKSEALERIRANMPGYGIISGFMFAFFVLLEMVPLALKWSLGKTEYHYYLEVRSNINNQKIISLANRYMSFMQRSEDGVIHTPAEITDMIAWLIEDESREHVAPMETRSLSDFIRGARTRRAANTASASSNANEPEDGGAPRSRTTDQPTPDRAGSYDPTLDEGEPQR